MVPRFIDVDRQLGGEVQDDFGLLTRGDDERDHHVHLARRQEDLLHDVRRFRIQIIITKQRGGGDFHPDLLVGPFRNLFRGHQDHGAVAVVQKVDDHPIASFWGHEIEDQSRALFIRIITDREDAHRGDCNVDGGYVVEIDRRVGQVDAQVAAAGTGQIDLGAGGEPDE